MRISGIQTFLTAPSAVVDIEDITVDIFIHRFHVETVKVLKCMIVICYIMLHQGKISFILQGNHKS